MPRTTFEQLLDAGVHFGHLKRKWNPHMAPYIFMEKNGIHIIDLHKTIAKIDEAANGLKQIAKSGRKILFVATKKQAKEIVDERIKQLNMPYVTERWPGGMLTNFPTIRKAVKRMSSIDKMATDGTFENISKREKLQITRQRAKLEKMLGSISDMSRLPSAMFIIDVTKEHIAVKEAKRLNIPLFAMVDTNSNPNDIDFPIPANDDASKSIALIVDIMAAAIEEGLAERKAEKGAEGDRPKRTEKKSKTRSRRSAARSEEDKAEGKSESEAKSAEKAEATDEVKTKPKAEKPAEETKAAEPKAEKSAEESATEKKS